MDIMKSLTKRDSVLSDYMKEWDHHGFDLIISPAAWMPAPLKVRKVRNLLGKFSV